MDTERRDASVADQRLSEVLGAYLEAMDAGWAPPQPELLARYPDLAHELADFFASQDQVVRLTSPCWPASLPSSPGNGPAQEKTGQPAGAEPSTVLQEDDLPLILPGGTVHSLGNYELIEEIGRGGMGIVFKARQVTPNRLVALKMILAGRFASADDVRRFYNEAEAAGNLDHPNIVPIYEVGEYRGRPYFSMKLFEAGSLTRHLPDLARDLRAAAQLLATVARAVHHAHQRGILHRDLKPGNILLDAQRQPHVTDFGLAKRLTSAPEAGVPNPESAGAPVPGTAEEGFGPKNGSAAVGKPAAGLVPSGFAGTPSYMPPEQAAGRKGVLTTAADVYSLGAILYKILTGRPPFHASTPQETRRQVQELQPERPRSINPQLERNLEAICLMCLEKDPGKRYASAEALAEDLEHWLRREPVLARRPPWPLRVWRTVRRNALRIAIAALCGFAVAAVLLYSYFTNPERPLEDMERQLARGEKVVLIDETGPPRWSHWLAGEDTVMISVDRNRPFSFSSFKTGRLQLLRTPCVPRYRFSAEVWHRDAQETGEAGIYFAYTARTVGNHVHRGWCELVFADQGKKASLFHGPGQKRLEPPKYSKLELILRGSGPELDSDLVTPVYKLYPAAAPSSKGPSPWRRLAVVVTPEKIQVFWEGAFVSEISFAQLRTLCNVPLPLNPKPEFAPDGSLGLCVLRGQASFRRVLVEPLE
jgi:serine/threonine-protein kinase